MAKEENPKSCERCGSEKQPINIFNPNTPGYPTKREALCAICAAKDPKVTYISGPGIGALVAPPQAPESVPPITPAVPEPPGEVETKEFGPKLAKLDVEPPAPVATPEPPGDLGPVPPEIIKQKLAVHEKEHDALIENRRKIQESISREQQQLVQISAIINAKRGAIAQCRDLLGNAS